MKQNNTLFSQLGRSMTEMLGVLVIIGVLSIAAILGYSYAIDKYRANETVQELNRRYLILNTQYNRNQTLNQDEFGSVTAQGYPIVAGLMTDQELGFYQELSNVPKGVCDQLAQSDYSAIISVNGKYLGTSDSACVDTNAVRFEYVSDTQWCVKLDDQGNCCDDKGRCCPSNKPLIDSAGKCRACEDSARAINIGANGDTCTRCPNRLLYKLRGLCLIDCPKNEYRDSWGSCRSCDEVVFNMVVDWEIQSNIEKILSCPKLVYGGGAHTSHCDTEHHRLGASPTGGCEKCSDRKLFDKRFCARLCPANQYQDGYGTCYPCNDIGERWIDTSPENLSKILACPRVVLGESSGYYHAQHCDLANQNINVRGYPELCAKCDNRQLKGNNCVLK